MDALQVLKYKTILMNRIALKFKKVLTKQKKNYETINSFSKPS